MPKTPREGPALDPPPPSSASHVLVISVWFETPDAGGLRARVSTTDEQGRPAVRCVTAKPADVLDAVTTWLDAVVSQRA